MKEICACCGKSTWEKNISYNGTTWGCVTCGNNLNGDPANRLGLNDVTNLRKIMSKLLQETKLKESKRHINTIQELQKIAFETAKEHGWHDEQRSFGDLIVLIHSEASEALEAFRENHDHAEQWKREDGKPEGVPSELADIVIRVFDMAELYKINLEQVIVEKMEFNKSRPFRHGGKKL